MPKIIDGGFIAGHDYGNAAVTCEGVKPAVDELFGKPDVVFVDYSWLVKKVAGKK